MAESRVSGYRVLYVTLAALFVIGFATTMWMAYAMPTYEDEPAWKLIGARLFVDGGKLLYFFPACDSGQWIDVPPTWYPARLIDSWLYQDASNLWYLRTIGWTLFPVLLASWAAILHVTSRLSPVRSLLFVAAYFSFGVLPLLMVFNRPEQSLLIWLTLTIGVMLWFEKHPVTSIVGKVGLTAVFALLCCLIGAAHPKGLFLFPVVLLAWWRTTRAPMLGIALLTVMAWSAADTMHVWSLRIACAESPWLTRILQSLSLQPHLLLEHPKEFWDTGTINLSAFDSYVKSIQFQQNYQSNWLPASTPPDGWLLKGLNLLTWLPFTVVATVGVINICRQIISSRARWWSVSFVMFISLVILVFLQSNKNFYEAGIIFPLVLLIFMLTFTPEDGIPNRMITKVLLPVMLAGAALTAFARLDVLSVDAYRWHVIRAEEPTAVSKLQAFARDQCNITDASENLVVDLSTYPAFWQHRRPMFMPYLAGWWATGTNYLQTLSKRNAGGVVSTCRGMPKELKDFSKQSDGVCCVSKDDLGKLPKQ